MFFVFVFRSDWFKKGFLGFNNNTDWAIEQRRYERMIYVWVIRQDVVWFAFSPNPNSVGLRLKKTGS